MTGSAAKPSYGGEEATVTDGKPPVHDDRAQRVLRLIPARPLISGFTVAVGVILAVTLASALSSISTVFVSLFLGLFLALGLDPAVRALERRGMTRGWGITVVAGAFMVLIIAILLVIIPATVRQFAHLVAAAPGAFEAVQASDWYQSVEAMLGVDLTDVVLEGARSFANVANFLAVSGGVLKAGFGVVGAVSSGVMVVVLTLYFVSSLEMIKTASAALVPAYRRTQFVGLFERITESVGAVVAGGIVLSTLNATIVFVLQLLVGSAVPVLMAFVAFFITLVPLIGSLVFLIIGSVGALFISPTSALVFLVAYFVYVQVEAYILTPRVMGKAVAVPAVLVITGAMVGAALMGLLGALVAIPITASVLIILRQVVVPRQDSRTVAPPE